MQKINGIFRYPGGKSRKSISNKILSYAPLFYEEYREPFAGGAGVFWKIPLHVKRWINDIDKDLISVYEALKNDPENFINLCRSISPAKEGEELTSTKLNGKKIYNKRLFDKFNELLSNKDSNQALRFFFVNRTVWLGRVCLERPSRLYYSNPNGWNIVEKDGVLETAAKICKNAKITCQSYENLLESSGREVFIYADPPYYKDTELSKNSKLYQHNFTEEDHIKLRDNIKKCKHKVLISYDNHEFIKDLYKNDFNIYEEEWTYSGTSSSEGHSKNKTKGKELIITNYND